MSQKKTVDILKEFVHPDRKHRSFLVLGLITSISVVMALGVCVTLIPLWTKDLRDYKVYKARFQEQLDQLSKQIGTLQASPSAPLTEEQKKQWLSTVNTLITDHLSRAQKNWTTESAQQIAALKQELTVAPTVSAPAGPSPIQNAATILLVLWEMRAQLWAEVDPVRWTEYRTRLEHHGVSTDVLQTLTYDMAHPLKSRSALLKDLLLAYEAYSQKAMVDHAMLPQAPQATSFKETIFALLAKIGIHLRPNPTPQPETFKTAELMKHSNEQIYRLLAALPPENPLFPLSKEFKKLVEVEKSLQGLIGHYSQQVTTPPQ